MNNLSLLLITFLSWNASAQVNFAITSFDLEKIATHVQASATGMNVMIPLSESVATCKVNNLSGLPGFSCNLVSKEGQSLLLNNIDFDIIDNAMTTIATGMRINIKLNTQVELSCRAYSTRGLPGYDCMANGM